MLDALALRVLREWAERSAPLENPATMPFQAPTDNPESRAWYDAGVRACLAEDAESLNEAVRHSWQAPLPGPEFASAHISAVRNFGKRLISEGRVDLAFRLGTQLRDCNGSCLHQIAGTSLRILARRAGFACADFPTLETLRAAGRSEVDRYSVPMVLTGDIHAILNAKAEAPERFFCYSYAFRVVYGGKRNVLDRELTWNRLLLVLDRLEGEFSWQELQRWGKEESGGAASVLSSPWDHLFWALRKRPQVREGENLMGRQAVGSVYDALYMVWLAHDKEREFAK